MFFSKKSAFWVVGGQRACVSVSDINQIELPNSSAGGIVRRHAYGVSARYMLFLGNLDNRGGEWRDRAEVRKRLETDSLMLR